MKKGKQDKNLNAVEKVVVAVKASKEIPKTALMWALTHVVQPGDCITLIVVVQPHKYGKKFWGFPRFAGDCANGYQRQHIETSSEQKSDITDSCSQMILRLHDVYDPNKINVKIKIFSGSAIGAVAAESKKTHANWVVLDKHLKQEEKFCMEELHCNIVVMKKSQPKVLRLNLIGSPMKEMQINGQSSSYSIPEKYKSCESNSNSNLNPTRGLLVTPTSSPEMFTATEVGTSSVSSYDPCTSPFFVSETNQERKKDKTLDANDNRVLNESSSDTESENLSSTSSSLRFQPWVGEVVSSPRCKNAYTSKSKALIDKETSFSSQNNGSCTGFGVKNMRDAFSSTRNGPLPGSPPLCSICQHKAPVFGKPPRWFTYSELEQATKGFSKANFLAEGGFGSVHRGVLQDGQVVAVKQHKLASSQGDQEFCSEVEVLSCAQHRNVVMLIGFCIEDGKRLLVYEYICNGSLDHHLYARNRDTLRWCSRQKIALGAARGLRYLHEECRVGCIVHRDMRPNNILVTHDFEPLVGDFGLARWQPDGDMGVETRVIGTFGYLAPEYTQSGQITEKADVYSFGVVLVELVTGRKAIDIDKPKGQQCLTEWARPLLKKYAIDELIDPRLGHEFVEDEVFCMLHAASMCIRRDPQARPKMSQVLRMLEGDVIVDSDQVKYDIGSSRSGSTQPPYHFQHRHCWGGAKNTVNNNSSKLSFV